MAAVLYGRRARPLRAALVNAATRDGTAQQVGTVEDRITRHKSAACAADPCRRAETDWRDETKPRVSVLKNIGRKRSPPEAQYTQAECPCPCPGLASARVCDFAVC